MDKTAKEPIILGKGPNPIGSQKLTKSELAKLKESTGIDFYHEKSNRNH